MGAGPLPATRWRFCSPALWSAAPRWTTWDSAGVTPLRPKLRKHPLPQPLPQVLRRRPRPLNLWVVLDEGALWRPVCAPATMRMQIRHIIEQCRRPNVTIQIAPLGISGQIAGDGSLTLVRFPQQGLQDMVYLERPDNAVYPTRRAEIEHHWHIFNTLVTEAAPPEQTPRVLARILSTY